MRYLSAWRQFSKLPASRMLLLFESVWWLTYAFILTRSVSFRTLSSRLGICGQVAPDCLTRSQEQFVKEVTWAIAAVCRRTPSSPSCLLQALAAKSMISRRQIPSTLYFGVIAFSESSGEVAHAWVRCGGRIVIGQSEATRFKPVAWFA